jgi:hypothetical protein
MAAEPTDAELASLGEAFLVALRKALPLLQRPVGEMIPSTGEAVYVPNQGDWTQEMVVRLRKELTYPAARTMLDLTAERPDQEVKFTEVVAKSGLPPRQVAAELGAMSKLSRKLFNGRKIWPVRWWQDASDNITRYVMQRGIAEWWRGSND